MERRILVLILFICCRILNVYGTTSIMVDSLFTHQKITVESDYLEDLLHDPDLYRVHFAPDSAWTRVPPNGLAKPQNPYAYWIRFDLDVGVTGDYYLSNDFTLLDSLVLFVGIKDSDEFEEIENLGDKLDIRQRRIQYRVPTFKFSLEAGRTYRFYLYGYKHQSTCMMPLHLRSEDHFIANAAKQENLNGLIYGMLLCFALMAFITGLFFKKRVYFIYSIHVMGLILFLLATLGTGLVYIWYGFKEFNTIAGYCATLITMSTLSLIIIDTLDVKHHYKLYYRIMLMIIYGYIFLTFGTYFLYYFLPQKNLMPLVRIGHTAIVLFPLLLFVICLKIYLKTRSRLSLYILLTFQITLISYLILPFTPLGIFPYEIYSYFKWTYPVESLFLLIVLLNDLYQSKIDKIHLQQSLLLEQRQSKIFYIEGESQERRRIARQLHDNLSIKMAVLKLSLAQIGGSYDKALKANNTIDEISADLRRITHALSPLSLEKSGLIRAIEEQIFEVEGYRTDLTIHCIYEQDFVEPSLKVGEVLYYSFLELFQNCLKHSGATEFKIELISTPDRIIMVVADNGKGYSPDNIATKGIGLHNIKTRVNMLNGSFDISPSSNGGIKHSLMIPSEH